MIKFRQFKNFTRNFIKKVGLPMTAIQVIKTTLRLLFSSYIFKTEKPFGTQKFLRFKNLMNKFLFEVLYHHGWYWFWRYRLSDQWLWICPVIQKECTTLARLVLPKYQNKNLLQHLIEKPTRYIKPFHFIWAHNHVSTLKTWWCKLSTTLTKWQTLGRIACKISHELLFPGIKHACEFLPK